MRYFGWIALTVMFCCSSEVNAATNEWTMRKEGAEAHISVRRIDWSKVEVILGFNPGPKRMQIRSVRLMDPDGNLYKPLDNAQRQSVESPQGLRTTISRRKSGHSVERYEFKVTDKTGDWQILVWLVGKHGRNQRVSKKIPLSFSAFVSDKQGNIRSSVGGIRPDKPSQFDALARKYSGSDSP